MKYIVTYFRSIFTRRTKMIRLLIGIAIGAVVGFVYYKLVSGHMPLGHPTSL